jgi:hypothetical protein
MITRSRGTEQYIFAAWRHPTSKPQSGDIGDRIMADFENGLLKMRKEGEEEEPPYQHFVDHRFQLRAYKIVLQARDIINEYAEQGYTLTLRQLFYQFVSRDLMENTKAKYDSLGRIARFARLNGMLPMWSIVDRTRGLSTWSTATGPKGALSSMVKKYRRDKWLDQDIRLEVWFEKDALAGIFEKACAEYEVPFASTRGYASHSPVHLTRNSRASCMHSCSDPPSSLHSPNSLTACSSHLASQAPEASQAPVSGLHSSPSGQATGVSKQTPSGSAQVETVHRSGALHATGVLTQPFCESHESLVQPRPSSQLTGARSLGQPFSSQSAVSSTVQASPSSQTDAQSALQASGKSPWARCADRALALTRMV